MFLIFFTMMLVQENNRIEERRRSGFSLSNKSSTLSNERNNTNYMVSKISREMQRICLERQLAKKEGNLNFSEFVIVLIEMEYVTQNLTNNERDLVNKIWDILKGDDIGGVSPRNLLFFLIGIHQLKVDQIFYKGKIDRGSKNKNPLIESSTSNTMSMI